MLKIAGLHHFFTPSPPPTLPGPVPTTGYCVPLCALVVEWKHCTLTINSLNAIKNTLINYTIIIILYDLIEPLIDSYTSKWCIVWYFGEGFWVISPPPWFGITVTLQFYCSFKIEQKHCILALNS